MTTKIENTTETPMKLVKMDQFAIRRIKRIESGKHIYLSNWDGIVSDNRYIEITYEVYPADMPDARRVRATFLPIDVYNNSDIKITRNIETGDMVELTFVPANGFLQRTSVVRWWKDLFAGLA